jgi:hypothetical protein
MLLAAATALAFLAFLPGRLWAWDPLQFALGLDHFSLRMHQPHAPGYVGYLALAWLLHQAGLAADRAVQAAGVLSAAAAVGVLYTLGRRIASARAGVVAALLLATNSAFCYQAVTGESYPAEALVGTLLVLAGLAIRPGGRLSDLAGLGLAYGLAGGVRQGIVVLFLPFFAWRVLHACRGAGPRGTVVRLALAGAGAGAGALAWLVPLLALAGGLRPWLELTRAEHFDLFARTYSPLFGASWAGVKVNLDMAWRFVASVVVPALPVALLLLPMGRDPRDGRSPPPALWWLWIGPPLAWIVAMWISKQGHALALAPGVALLAAVAIERLPAGASLKSLLAGAVVAAQLALFLAPPEAWSATVSASSAPALELADTDTAAQLDAIRGLAGDDPASVVVAARDGLPSFRTAMVYLPDTPVWWLMDAGSTGVGGRGVDACEGLHGQVDCLSGAGFWERSDLPPAATVPLSAAVRAIVWAVGPADDFARALGAAIPARQVPAGRHGELAVTDVPPGPFTLRAGPYTFVR